MFLHVFVCEPGGGVPQPSTIFCSWGKFVQFIQADSYGVLSVFSKEMIAVVIFKQEPVIMTISF